MSEPSLERLIRFTPNAGGLDRDALLFAAGRASARPSRGWKTLASGLAGTQVLSLALLWPRPAPPSAGIAVPVAAVPEPPSTPEPPTSEPRAIAGIWSARHSRLASETTDCPAGDATLIESGPPLRASGPLPLSLLN
jgi:hypothetical protein